jgi:hypothetical protein
MNLFKFPGEVEGLDSLHGFGDRSVDVGNMK